MKTIQDCGAKQSNLADIVTAKYLAAVVTAKFAPY